MLKVISDMKLTVKKIWGTIFGAGAANKNEWFRNSS